MPLKDLMLNVVMGNRDEYTVTSLANRLARLNNEIDEKERAQFRQESGGKAITEVIHELFDSFNPHKNIDLARTQFKLLRETEPGEEQVEKVQQKAPFEAAKVFENPKLREFVENARKAHEQIINTVNLDKVIFAGYDGQAKEQATAMIQDLRHSLKKTEIQ